VTLELLPGDHPFLRTLVPEHLALLAECAGSVRFGEGSFMFREDEVADRCFLIREGKIALEIAAANRGSIIVQTLATGDVVGFSWLLEPRQWQFDARVIEPVQAIALDGICLRQKCADDPRLGFELMELVARLAIQRLQATRLRLLDVYGSVYASAG
jgi:CRP/FNR family cyclic AMP-dependent transcriptional regulator